ncbi:MAG: hypothetical protein DDT37_00137 [Firmicutes bacterium]|nr:hypothetical protein [candidate division NPL-UPA2 bacterium]
MRKGEALRALLRHAEEALTRAEKFAGNLEGERVLSLAQVSFGNFAYVRETHAVYLNEAHLCLDYSFVNIGELLLEAGLGNEAGLHFLSAYQAARPHPLHLRHLRHHQLHRQLYHHLASDKTHPHCG